MTYLKLETLARLDACRDYRSKFEQLFGEGVEVTVELCEKHAGDFDWEWAVGKLLTGEQRAEFWETVRPALEKCKATYFPAMNKMDAVTNAAYDKYDAVWRDPHASVEARNAAQQEYNDTCDKASAEYSAVRDPAWAAYYVTCAKTFGELFCKGE